MYMKMTPHNSDEDVCARLLPDLSLVESQLLTLENVAIYSSTLSRSASDNGIQSSGLKLSLQCGLDFSHLGQSLLMLVLHTLALLRLLSSLLILLPSSSQSSAVVSLIPRPKRGSIDLHNSRSRQGIRSDKFVVGRVESDDDDTGLAGDTLAAPGEVAGFEAQCSELAVAASGSDEMDALVADSSIGRLTTFLESSAENVLDTFSAGLRRVCFGVEIPLLSVVRALGTRCGSLVAGVS